MNNEPNPIPGGWSLREVFRDIWVAWRLLLDPQVSFLLKLMLPVLALAYWISPVDLLPGLPFDDFIVILVASRVFVSMAPPDALARALQQGLGDGMAAWFNRQRANAEAKGKDDDVVDTTWHVVDEE